MSRWLKSMSASIKRWVLATFDRDSVVELENRRAEAEQRFSVLENRWAVIESWMENRRG